MRLLREVIVELVGMFVGDAWLSLGIIALIALAGALIDFAHVAPAIGAAVLVVGCPLLLIENVRRQGMLAPRR